MQLGVKIGPDTEPIASVELAHLDSRQLAALRCAPSTGWYDRPMVRATQADWDHFAAIAEAEAESERDAFAEAARTPPGERILEGARLGALVTWTPAHLAEIDARVDGEMELARRRVARSLTHRP